MITFISQKIIALIAGKNYPWTYRVAFLIGFFVALYWADTSSAIIILEVFVGAFAGGLAATALDKGMWENSYPPSEQIQTEIIQYHEKVIKNLRPVSHLKHAFDTVLALAGLVVLLPLFIILSFLIWFEDPGPVFFIKYSTGRGGATFPQIKFRSMIQNAESDTGPIPASVKDPRRLQIGRVIRLLRVDELPQLLNILRGEMSFVGPRPLRAVDVHKFLLELPEFAERHAVLPGIAGLSQAEAGYYIGPKDRLHYDLLYIQNQSFSLDTRLLFQSVLSIHKNYNNLLPDMDAQKHRLNSPEDIETKQPDERMADGKVPGRHPPA
jgi:lipopolysaccharide/colanic/teichoic acid biosynthesis glycosyltransferase